MDLLKSRKMMKTLEIRHKKRLFAFQLRLRASTLYFSCFFFLSFLLDDDAMMIILLLYALVLLRSFVGRFALITIASDRVCDAVFQAGERACKSSNEKLKNSKRKHFHSDCIIKNISYQESHTFGLLYNDYLVSQSFWIKTEIGFFLFIFVCWSSAMRRKTRQKKKGVR